MKGSPARDNIAVLTAFVVLALAAMGLVARCGSGSHTPSASPTLQTSQTVTPKASHPPVHPTATPTAPATASVNKTTLHTLAKRAQPVIRLYASFPNEQKAPALIKQLRPLVEPVVMTNLARQWGTSTHDTVRAKVLKISAAGEYAWTSHKVEVDAVVAQEFIFAQTPANTHLLGVAVTFEQRDNKWVITSVADKQGDL